MGHYERRKNQIGSGARNKLNNMMHYMSGNFTSQKKLKLRLTTGSFEEIAEYMFFVSLCMMAMEKSIMVYTDF